MPLYFAHPTITAGLGSALLLLTGGAPSAPTAGLLFDTAHVEAAFDYFTQPTEAGLHRIAATAATRHLLRHSAVTGYYPPETDALELSRRLLDEAPAADSLARARELLRYVRAAPSRQQACGEAAARHLPEGFRFAEPLYLTWGYDIGVSMSGSASLNLAHPRFATEPEELWLYCTHEMHHAGLTSFHPFPRPLAEIRTAAQMLELIRYATMLEGMAVHAAREPRRQAERLDADPDYVALGDTSRMGELESRYWRIYDSFAAAGDRPLTEEDWRQLESLSDGDRLWYRVGALIASRLEAELGTERYRELPRQGVDAFFAGQRPRTQRAPARSGFSGGDAPQVHDLGNGQ